MSYFTRQLQALVPVKKYNEDQPRDENGRWTAISYGSGEFGLQHTVSVGGKSSRSTGFYPQQYTSMDAARAAADQLNRVETYAKTGTLIRPGMIDKTRQRAGDILDKVPGWGKPLPPVETTPKLSPGQGENPLMDMMEKNYLRRLEKYRKDKQAKRITAAGKAAMKF